MSCDFKPINSANERLDELVAIGARQSDLTMYPRVLCISATWNQHHGHGVVKCLVNIEGNYILF